MSSGPSGGEQGWEEGQEVTTEALQREQAGLEGVLGQNAQHTGSLAKGET